MLELTHVGTKSRLVGAARPLRGVKKA